MLKNLLGKKNSCNFLAQNLNKAAAKLSFLGAEIPKNLHKILWGLYNADVG